MKEMGHKILIPQAKDIGFSVRDCVVFILATWNWLPVAQAWRVMEALSFASRAFMVKEDLYKRDDLYASSFCSQQTYQK